MGLYSMPTVVDAFFPLVIFAHMLMPLLLLKNWIALRVMGQEEAARDSAEDLISAGNDVSCDRVIVGVHVTQFRDLCPDAAAAVDDAESCCCVCLHEFEKNEEISQVLACSHFFHRACLDRWLLDQRRSTCPLCRTSTTTVA